MNVSRRGFVLGGAAAAAAVALPGCKTLPGEGALRLACKAVGAATGLVLGLCDVPPATRNVVIDVVNRCRACVPQEGETIRDVWSRIADRVISDALAKGELSAAEAAFARAAVALVLRGWAIVEERHPSLRIYENLAFAAVDGFCDGLLATYRPANGCDDCGEETIDVKAYETLRSCGEASRFRMITRLRPKGS